MKRITSIAILVVTLGLFAVVGFSSVASADQSCYTGCNKTVTPPHQPPSVTQTPAPVSGFAFTGVDVIELAGLAGVAFVAGFALVGASRRRRIPVIP